MTEALSSPCDYDVVIVGAGFSGLYLLHKMRSHGMRALVIEKGSGVGGTWYWNRYPGARCDVPSLAYSVSYLPELDQEWRWPEAFATQADILSYIEHIAKRLDLYRDISFNSEVVRADWHNAQMLWAVATNANGSVTTRFLVMATGTLTVPRTPGVAGIETFRGRWFHTGRWPKEPISFKDRRVAVVGTGSTGIQVISALAGETKQLVVYQRTPKFTVPLANRPLSDEEVREMKQRYGRFREDCRRADFGYPVDYPTVLLTELASADRERLLEEMWNSGRYPAWVVGYQEHLALKNEPVNELIADFARRKIRQIVKDPKTAETLTPLGYPMGINRLCRDTDYYASFNRPNVQLIDTRLYPILAIEAAGLRTAEGVVEVDDIIFATGYDALTGAITAVDIRGRDSSPIREHWQAGARTYLGVATHNYPNLFFITAPGGPSVLSNVIVTSEQNVEFITDIVAYMNARHLKAVEASRRAEEDWMGHVADVASQSLYRKAAQANAWYTGKNVPGKKVMFLPYAGGVGRYGEICADIARQGYRGFEFLPARGSKEFRQPKTAQ